MPTRESRRRPGRPGAHDTARCGDCRSSPELSARAIPSNRDSAQGIAHLRDDRQPPDSRCTSVSRARGNAEHARRARASGRISPTLWATFRRAIGRRRSIRWFGRGSAPVHPASRELPGRDPTTGRTAGTRESQRSRRLPSPHLSLVQVAHGGRGARATARAAAETIRRRRTTALCEPIPSPSIAPRALPIGRPARPGLEGDMIKLPHNSN